MPVAEPTRAVFGNIAPWMQAVFFLLILGSLGVSAIHLAGMVRGWRAGAAGEWERRPRELLRRLLVEVLGQRRVRRRSLGGLLHAPLFAGFMLLALGTTLLFIADKGPAHFHRGAYYLAFELVMDLAGLAFLGGCALALYRRLAARPAALGHSLADLALLGLLLAVGITGFLLEGFRLGWDGTPAAVARWSPVGNALRALLAAGGPPAARAGHLAVWWVHVLLIAALFALWTRTRLLHAITGTLHLLVRPAAPMGALPTRTLAEMESSGRMGLVALEQLTGVQRLSLDACMECGRCEEACPAHATGKPLSPKAVVQDLRTALAAGDDRPLAGGVIAAETLWACTTCHACVGVCPVGIAHVPLIVDLRRHLVGEGQLAGPPAQALRRLAAQGSPHGQAANQRLAWAEGLDVPTTEQNPDFEVLMWVGCAAAFDPRARRVARALVLLLQRAGVSFAVLGRRERCTGDPARRLGEEILFQQLAGENGAALQGALNGREARTVVTPCPHCFNSLRHEYGDVVPRLDVRHHSQYLAGLLESGRLKVGPEPAARERVTLHDPCYLARVNGETESTRRLLAAAGADLVEMPRHGAGTFCCGAGGGRMWFEERPEQRVNRLRAAEAAATGARTLATACPFCLNMMTDGAAATEGEMRVMDVAELLLERLNGSDRRETAS